ncbi:unnamed protein product [Caenorhabditis angaria]|uniref:Dolichyl-diphosphooligosaccharide--protein glycosyltransferase subunit 2 n=1 Tax=Caenorhabditis angaria TaxID=860376 RepID=A0A9P1I7C2_9PELO|nr:unnamed protein product [Caenorhabditis angaria]
MSLLILSILFIATASQEIAVQNFRVGILAKDQEATNEHLKTIPAFSKSSELFSASDAGQRLYISFNLLNKADNSKFSGAQQVFLHFAQESGEDAVLVANPQASGEYLYDATLRVASKQFNNLAGKFKGSLIIGGNTIKTPINWYFADFQLALPTIPIITPKSQQINYSQLPEIQHEFRQPEKRPSAVISDFFTLVVLTPLLFLVGAWLKIGINFGNAPASIWVPIFHAGLAGIVGLFFVFWLQLDMFETLKYLAILGFVTFVAGNRVLRQLAAASKSKSE